LAPVTLPFALAALAAGAAFFPVFPAAASAASGTSSSDELILHPGPDKLTLDAVERAVLLQ
jgi:hypothetical protein